MGAALAYVNATGSMIIVSTTDGSTNALPGAGTSASCITAVGRGICFAAGDDNTLRCAGVVDGLAGGSALSSPSAVAVSPALLTLPSPAHYMAYYRGRLFFACNSLGVGPQLCVYNTGTNEFATPSGPGLVVPYGSFSPVGDILFFAAYALSGDSATPLPVLWAISTA